MFVIDILHCIGFIISVWFQSEFISFFSLILWCWRSVIRFSSPILGIYDVSPCIFSMIEVVIPAATW